MPFLGVKFLKISLIGVVLCAVAMCLAGCGGLLSANSTVLIHLKQNPNIVNPTSQVMTNYEVYVTTNGTTPLNLANTTTWASSSTNNGGVLDNWVGSHTSGTEIDIQFTTRSPQVPYYIYVLVPTEGGLTTDTVGLSVDVDASTGAVKAFVMPNNATSQVTSAFYVVPVLPAVPAQINHNSASY
jgi:hypothetical protein